MTPAAIICIPLKRIFVWLVAAGRLKGPPKERISAARDTERKMVAGLWANRISNPKTMVAKRPAMRVNMTGITTDIGIFM
jgi:hypothetical protein